MIIGIDASRANRKYKTGTEWYSYYLIKNLAEVDHKNTYWLYTDAPLVGGLLEVVKNHKNFKERNLRWPFSSFWTLGRLSLEMLIPWRRPRVLFVPAHSLPLFFPRRTVNTIHDIAFVREACVYEGLKTAKSHKFLKKFLLSCLKYYFYVTTGKFDYCAVDYLNWTTRFALEKARRIITVSDFTKQEIIDFYRTNPSKMVVVHNGYNNELYKKISDDQKIDKVRQKYGLNFSFLLCVGRMEKKKNIPLLIEAFALLKEKHPEIKEKLLFIGQAGYGYDQIKYAIEEYNLNSEVVTLGWVDEADMPYIHNTARAFVFPSRHEGFGIPVLQALACGLPTAVSDIPVLREVAGEAVLYFDKDDRYDMAEKLYALLTDTELRKKLAIAGREQAKHFSWKKCALETLEVLKKV
jgi:glycosyltransferase involved in cell wall biosynthesis